jgi:hypothetical protein
MATIPRRCESVQLSLVLKKFLLFFYLYCSTCYCSLSLCLFSLLCLNPGITLVTAVWPDQWRLC